MNQNQEIDVHNITKYTEPGVFRVVFLKENKAFFKTTSDMWFGIREFSDDLYQAKCKNRSLLQDFQTYGNYAFKYNFVVYGPE